MVLTDGVHGVDGRSWPCPPAFHSSFGSAFKVVEALICLLLCQLSVQLSIVLSQYLDGFPRSIDLSNQLLYPSQQVSLSLLRLLKLLRLLLQLDPLLVFFLPASDLSPAAIQPRHQDETSN